MYCLANWDAAVVLSDRQCSLICINRDTQWLRKCARTRVSGVFKPPFRDLVTLRTGSVWPRLLFSLECPLLSVFPPSLIRATIRREILIALPCFDQRTMMSLYRRHVIKENITPTTALARSSSLNYLINSHSPINHRGIILIAFNCVNIMYIP